jgi:hypothetical protein
MNLYLISNKIRKFIIVLLFGLTASLTYPMVAMAAPSILLSEPVNFAAATPASASQSQSCTGLSQLSGAGCGNNTGTAAASTITNIVNFMSILVGVVVIIMVIVAGFQYITSSGDSAKISKAKTALVYALVGLVLVAMAQFLVQFVLTKSSSAIN